MDENVSNTDKLELEAGKLLQKTLSVLIKEKDRDVAVNDALKSACEFYRADRAYIFEERGETYINSYEWCSENVQSFIGVGGGLKTTEIAHLIKTLQKGESVFVTDLESVKDSDPLLYSSSKGAGVNNFILAPLSAGSGVFGFIGIDNASEEIAKACHGSLVFIGYSVGQRIYGDRERASLVAKADDLALKLKEEKKQFGDALLSDSVLNFKLDLSEGYIKAPIVSLDGKVLPVEGASDGAMHYDAYMRKLLTENRAIFVVKSTEAVVLSQLRLLNIYSQGKTHYGAEVYLPTLAKHFSIDILMSDSIEKKGHVNATVVFFDTSALKMEEAKTRAIVGSLTGMYYGIYHFLLTENIFEIVKNQGIADDLIPAGMDVEEFFKWYVSEFVLSSSKVEMREFFDLSTLDRRFAETDSLSIDFRRKSVGWCRATMAVTMRRSDGGVASFVLGFSVIDEQKQKELQSAHEIQQQWFITKSFTGVYSMSWIVDLDENRLDEISVPEEAAKVSAAGAGDVSEGFNCFLAHFVAKQHVNDLRLFLNVNTLADRTAGKKLITFEYLDADDEPCRASFIPMSDGTNRYIYAVQSIGGEKEEESKTAIQDAVEAARIANRVKTDFFTNMSQDIITPMNAIINMAAVATNRLDDSGRVADCLKNITVSAKHYLGLVNEVLDMSRIASGNLVLQTEEFSLPQLLDELLIMCKPQIEAKGHELSVAVQNIDHETVVGDGQRIQEVFRALMSNAVKYTPDGGKIRLAVTEMSTTRPHVSCYEFVFEDNGVGMSKEFQAKQFEPFEMENNARLSGLQGTGLGLPIAQNLVHLMNGDIKVESELNKGTCVTVTIYLKTIDEASGETVKFTDLPVLVIDDDEMESEAICATLKELGVESESVLSGKEALKRAAKRRKNGSDYFAVLLDWKTEDADSVAVIKELKKQLGGEVPVIVASAFEPSDVKEQAMQAGATAFTAKPLFKSRLVRLLKEVSGRVKDEEVGADVQAIRRGDFSGKRILLAYVDDTDAEAAGRLSEATGLAVEYVRDGKEAVRAMNEAPDGYFDLVFMDVQMPQMNGYETAKLIRSSERDYLRSVPILAIMANASEEDVRRAINSGMNEQIAKPLEIESLFTMIRRWL